MESRNYYGIPERSPQQGDFEKKKNRGKSTAVVTVISIAAAFAVLAGSVIAVPQLRNLALRTILPPKIYFAHVMKKEINRISDAVSSAYAREGIRAGDGIRGSILVEDREKLFEIVNDITGDALEEADELTRWIDNVQISFTSASENFVDKADITIGINGEDIMELDAAADNENHKLYVSVPELNRKALAIDIKEDEKERSSVSYGDIVNFAPEEQTAKEIIRDYAMTALKQIEIVEKSKDKLSSYSVSAEYPSYTAKLDRETVRRISKSVLTKARDDSRLERIICGDDGLEGVDRYRKFIEGIDSVLERADGMDETVSLKIWTGAVGEIAGIELADTERTFRAADIKDKNISYESISFSLDDGTFLLGGKSEESGSGRNGDYVFSLDGEELLKINAENLRTHRGVCEGNIVIAPDESLFDYAPEFLRDLKLTWKGEADSGNQRSVLTLMRDGYELVRAEFEPADESSVKADIPSEYADAGSKAAMLLWMADCSMEPVVGRLRAAGASVSLPDILDMLMKYTK